MSRFFASVISALLLLAWVLLIVPMGVSQAAPLGLPDASKPNLPPIERRPSPRMDTLEPKVLSEPEKAAKSPPVRGDETAIHIENFAFEGVQDYPEYDLYVADLRSLAEEAKAQLQLRKWRRLSITKPSADTKQPSPAPAKKPPPESLGLTIAELQEIAATVARYYRQHGFLLAQAYIPAQTLSNNTLIIGVMEGRLGRVLVEKARRYDPEMLANAFVDLKGKPVIKEQVEETLLLLSDYPGLKVFGVFQPGSQTGYADLLISVLEEDKSDVALHVDNYGSEYTGEYRTRVDVAFNNPFKKQDRLTLGVSKTFQPANGFYGALGYERIAFGPKNRFGVSYSKNAYSLGGVLEDFGIHGTTQVAKAYWRRAFSRSRTFNSNSYLELAQKIADLDVIDGEDQQDKITTVSLGLSFDGHTQSRSIFNSGGLTFTQGFENWFDSMEATSDPDQTTASRYGNSGEYAGSDFQKVFAHYHYWQNLSREHALSFSLQGQYSKDLLISLEQMPLGGPNGVRAYSPSEYLRDTAYFASLEWVMRAPGFSRWPAFGGKSWGEVLQLVLFVDTATGWLNEPLASEEEEVTLNGAGLGIHFNLDDFSARFEFATPFGDKEAANGRDPQYFFEFNLGF
jgi:hemolysin activation/secretion protein